MFGQLQDPWRTFEGKWCLLRLHDGLCFEGTITRVRRDYITLGDLAVQEQEVPGVKPVTYTITKAETILRRLSVQFIREASRDYIEMFHEAMNKHRAATPGHHI